MADRSRPRVPTTPAEHAVDLRQPTTLTPLPSARTSGRRLGEHHMLEHDLTADLDAFEDWMIGRGFAATTVEQRLVIVAACLRRWEGWDVRASEIALWLREHEGWTARTYFLHARCAFAWAVESGRATSDPTAGFRTPPSPRPRPRPLPPAVLRHALDTAHGDLRTYLMLAYLAGLRAHEVAKLRGEDITVDTMRVVGKGAQLAEIPTHPALWALAQDYPQNGHWFPSPHRSRVHVGAGSVSYVVRTHLRGLGVESGSIHRVRASYGTELLRSGTNVRVVQKLMRHSSLATTERYLEATKDEQRDGILGLVA